MNEKKEFAPDRSDQERIKRMERTCRILSIGLLVQAVAYVLLIIDVIRIVKVLSQFSDCLRQIVDSLP